jgi:hypothetical protein
MELGNITGAFKHDSKLNTKYGAVQNKLLKKKVWRYWNVPAAFFAHCGHTTYAFGILVRPVKLLPIHARATYHPKHEGQTTLVKFYSSQGRDLLAGLQVSRIHMLDKDR